MLEGSTSTELSNNVYTYFDGTTPLTAAYEFTNNGCKLLPASDTKTTTSKYSGADNDGYIITVKESTSTEITMDLTSNDSYVSNTYTSKTTVEGTQTYTKE